MHTRGSVVRRAILSALAAVTIGATSAMPATAAEGDAPLVFATFSSDSFTDVYEAMLAANDPATVAAFLETAATDSAVASGVPGLDLLSSSERETVLLDSSESASQGEGLPASTTAVLAATADDPEYGTASYSTAAVRGGQINSGFSWRLNERIEVKRCAPSCVVTSAMDLRFTTNPGKSATVTNLNFGPKTGTQIQSRVELSSRVYLNGTSVSHVASKGWNTPGSGTQYNYHSSSQGKRFEGYYYFVSHTSVGDRALEWKTGRTAACGAPNGGAYACRWPT